MQQKRKKSFFKKTFFIGLIRPRDDELQTNLVIFKLKIKIVDQVMILKAIQILNSFIIRL